MGNAESLRAVLWELLQVGRTVLGFPQPQQGLSSRGLSYREQEGQAEVCSCLEFAEVDLFGVLEK